MVTPLSSPPEFNPDRIDQRVTLHGVSWDAYEALLTARGESAGVRLTYLKGELELMTPSIDHEALKKRLARLLEAYAEECGVELEGYGSWTVRRAERERGVEPDECYVLGPRDPADLDVPDIAIEVVWTSGGLDKLEVYTGLGVRELWIWQEGALTFHDLRGNAYVRVSSSELLPNLDASVLASFMSGASQTQAVRSYRKALREQGAEP